MRVLMVVPPLVGHINPTVALGQALLARGHQVAWCGFPAALAERIPEGGELLALSHGMSEQDLERVRAAGLGLRGAAAFKFLWEDLFFPLSRAMLPGVEEAARAWRPDGVVHDQQAFAGALAARRLSLPFVTSAATSAQLADPFDGLPQFRDWLNEGLSALQEQAGVVPSVDGLLSPQAVIAWSTRALVGDRAPLPPQTVLVGPATAPRPKPPPFDWDRLDGRPLVYVSLGTVSVAVGERFFGVAAEAFRAMPDVQGVMVAPHGAVDAPDNLLCQHPVPQLELLRRASVVVCHAGHNTTVEALAEGLPLVVAPIRDDQPVVAQQVVEAGAGERLRFGRLRAPTLVSAIRRVGDDPSYRRAAETIAASFRAAGGPTSAAEVVERALARKGGA